MNKVRQIQELNARELEAGTSPSGSWHRDFDSAYIYIGGLPYELSEGDVVSIFSQFGEPTYINLVRDRETGKSKGFAFLKYEDQRSTDLAVDNLCGANIMGRTIIVDHSNYRKKEDEDTSRDNTDGLKVNPRVSNSEQIHQLERIKRDVRKRPLLKEEIELESLQASLNQDDPMRDYLIEEKRAEVSAVAMKFEDRKRREKKYGQSTSHDSRRARERHRNRRSNSEPKSA